jgi:hypothetical protein
VPSGTSVDRAALAVESMKLLLARILLAAVIIALGIVWLWTAGEIVGSAVVNSHSLQSDLSTR